MSFTSFLQALVAMYSPHSIIPYLTFFVTINQPKPRYYQFSTFFSL